ncbi:glucose-6-phosphate dehydrogenase [Actinomycetospora sp. OC33-EN08]|uniref:Glucose-6-phosphate 1-dehydrogenase n=1 Tax=Actinomycetospora aurantiaca TaxID=3129233 RepID=A0ABU8MRK3_9PSEU
MTDPGDTPPTVFVLFGASGDLAARLVLPAFYRLAQEGLLPPAWQLIGSGRRELSDDDFRAHVHDKLTEFGPKPEEGPWEEFAARLRFASNGFSVDDPGQLVDTVAAAEQELGDGDPSSVQRVHYLGVPPTAFEPTTNALGAHGLAERSRVVYEKPFGTSLESFHSLDQAVHRVFDESAIYRIDHFLGKEATQQLRAVRFANGLFGSSWDRHHVESVQIDVPETLDVADRAEFYDETGAVLDMLVTHLFQVAAEVAMEPPRSLASDDVAQARADAVKAFVPLRAEDVVRGQFDGYRDIDDVADDSDTETFVAARMFVDTERWRDVPFLMRTGKKMAESHQKVTLVMRDPDDGPYHPTGTSGAGAEIPSRGNVLCFDLSGDGRLALSMNIEVPGSQSALETAWTEINLHEVDGGDPLPPYVRLIHDILIGDRSLFTRPDGLEEVWHAAGAALNGSTSIESYAPGSWGPDAALRLAEPRGWALGDR